MLPLLLPVGAMNLGAVLFDICANDAPPEPAQISLGISAEPPSPPQPAPDFPALAATAFAFAPVVGDAATLTPEQPQDSSAPSAQQATAGVSSQPDPAHPSPIPPLPGDNPFFHRGSWRYQFTLAAGADSNSNNLYFGGVAFSYFLEDNFTVDFEVNGAYWDQHEGNDTGGVNLAMLLRWHFWRWGEDRYSLYTDAGIGLALSADDVPGTGSDFNFTPAFGIGISAKLATTDTRLLAGIRWHHISNANIFRSNPGDDRLMVYAGLNFPF